MAARRPPSRAGGDPADGHDLGLRARRSPRSPRPPGGRRPRRADRPHLGRHPPPGPPPRRGVRPRTGHQTRPRGRHYLKRADRRQRLLIRRCGAPFRTAAPPALIPAEITVAAGWPPAACRRSRAGPRTRRPDHVHRMTAITPAGRSNPAAGRRPGTIRPGCAAAVRVMSMTCTSTTGPLARRTPLASAPLDPVEGAHDRRVRRDRAGLLRQPADEVPAAPHPGPDRAPVPEPPQVGTPTRPAGGRPAGNVL
jgi:hypothetical protein